MCFFFFFQAEDGIRDLTVTGVQTCALPILPGAGEGSLADCLQRAMEQRRSRLLALAAGWDDKAQRLQLWLDGQLDGHGALWDKRKLQPARYTGWLAALADWSRAPLDGPLALTEAARQIGRAHV